MIEPVRPQRHFRLAPARSGFLLLVLLATSHVLASAEPAPPAATTTTNALVKEIAPGLFQIGDVRLDQRQRIVSFPAAINMDEGLIEYLIVHSSGKTHESLLQTAVEPYHLQTAMLLLGARGAPTHVLTNAPDGGPLKGAQLSAENTKPIRGDPVNLAVRWRMAGLEKSFRLEELVLDVKQKSRMSSGPFTFNGSRVWAGRFIAQTEGSIVSLITDEDALFNNPRPGREDDSNWQIISEKLPPRGTPVQVTIQLTAKPARK